MNIYKGVFRPKNGFIKRVTQAFYIYAYIYAYIHEYMLVTFVNEYINVIKIMIKIKIRAVFLIFTQ